jgi:hypothetical protein
VIRLPGALKVDPMSVIFEGAEEGISNTDSDEKDQSTLGSGVLQQQQKRNIAMSN